MSSHIAEALLDADLIYQFHDLLDMIFAGDERFFWFNDVYFMSRLQDVRLQGKVKDRRVAELIEMLLYRRPPKTLHHSLFQHRILKCDGDDREKTQLTERIQKKVKEFEQILKRHGKGRAWILADIPQKDVVFTRGIGALSKKGTPHLDTEAVKVISKLGKPSLLVQRENALMKHLSGFINFVPSVYANDAAVELLRRRRMIS